MIDPKWVQPYKIQDEKKPPLSKYLGAFKVILANQFIAGPLITLFWYFPAVWFGELIYLFYSNSKYGISRN